MIIDIKDNNFILIAPSKYHLDLIKYFAKYPQKNYKLYTKEQLIADYYGKYDQRAIIHAMNKYDYSYENAKMLLNNIYYQGELMNNKFDLVNNLKKDLSELNLLRQNDYLSYELQNKPIYLMGYGEEDSALDFLFLKLKVLPTYLPFVRGEKRQTVFSFQTLEDEAYYLFNTINDLIKNGIEQKKIVLIIESNKYEYVINHMAKQFDLPNLLVRTNNYLLLPKVQEIIKNIEATGIEEFLYHNEFSDDEFVLQTIKIINDYQLLSIHNKKQQVYALRTILKSLEIKEDFNPFIRVQESITFANADNYYFLFGFNQGAYPSLRKDDDYLSDEEKKVLHLSTSNEINRQTKEEIIDFLTNAEHLIVTYHLFESGEKTFPSSLIKELDLKVEGQDSKIIYSKKQAQVVLAKLEDMKRKYDSYSRLYDAYSNTIDIAYQTYDNSYQSIGDYEIKPIRQYSYSKIKSFFECQFRYYLINVLRLNDFEETFPQKMGSLFHEILTHVYEDDFDFAKVYETIIAKYDFSIGEKTILIKKSEELEVLCQVLREHMTSMNVKDMYFEKKIIVPISNDVRIEGNVDKIVVTTDGSKDYYSIIDYKTGSETFDKSELEFGLSMQLPTYALLLSQDEEFKDKELIGFYIQKITSDKIGIPEDYYSFYRKLFVLNGESTNDIEKMKTFDTTCADSLYVKSYSIKNNGEFGKNARINSNEDFQKMISLTRDNFLSADKKIIEGDFKINPKIKEGKDKSDSTCKFCPFNDICNVKDKDYEYLIAKGDEE